jgi:hypothetical protein
MDLLYAALILLLFFASVGLAWAINRMGSGS